MKVEIARSGWFNPQTEESGKLESLYQEMSILKYLNNTSKKIFFYLQKKYGGTNDQP